MKRYALITPKPESAARGTLVRPAPTQGAAGLGEGSRKCSPQQRRQPVKGSLQRRSQKSSTSETRKAAKDARGEAPLKSAERLKKMFKAKLPQKMLEAKLPQQSTGCSPGGENGDSDDSKVELLAAHFCLFPSQNRHRPLQVRARFGGTLEEEAEDKEKGR